MQKHDPLGRFLAASVVLHTAAVFLMGSPLGSGSLPAKQREATIVVDVTPLTPPAPEAKPPEPKRPPVPKPQPQVRPKPQPVERAAAKRPEPARRKEPAPRRPIERGVPWMKPKGPQVAELPRGPARPDEPGGEDPSKLPEPLPRGVPTGKVGFDLPRVRMALLPKEGGGSPAMGPVPGGSGGYKAPEKDEDLMFNGGGAGGLNLPKAAPRVGGGGGQDLLAARSLLTDDLIRDEKPGVGPGTGGGTGAGSGGGVGFARGKGIGVSPTSLHDLSTLRRKAGEGIGAGKGRGIGTNSPGGGKGTGSQVPGTGGTGLGYGRGQGIGFGSGAGGGRRVAQTGIPWGDPRGLLGGNPRGGGGTGGGPGGRGPGGGGGTGTRPGGRLGIDRTAQEEKGSQKIVYLLDCSSSMRDKIAKAKDALKEAIASLRDGDEFNIITFNRGLGAMSGGMMRVNRTSRARSDGFIDAIGLRQGTYLSGALEQAFALRDISTVVLISDGEPSVGVTDPGQILSLVRQWNRGRARLLTIAISMGDRFENVQLLQALARQNGGYTRLIDLSRH